MANRIFNPTRALEKELITIAGRIPLSAAAAVGTVVGRGFSVAKTGTGLYTVTLEDAYNALIGFSLSVLGSGTVVTVPELSSQDVGSRTLVIKTVTRSTGAAANTGVAFEIGMTLHLRNSTVA